MEDSDQAPGRIFDQALRLTEGTYNIVFCRLADPNILPFFHVVLVFIYHISSFPKAMGFIGKTFPWRLVSLLLNSVLLSYRDYDRIKSVAFPRSNKEPPRPLPEDFAMNGLVWVEKYFPVDWFSNEKINDEEKYFEVPSMTEERKERILWLGCRIAEMGEWLTYDASMHHFGALPQYDIDIGIKPLVESEITTPMDTMTTDSTCTEGSLGIMTPADDREVQEDGSIMDVDQAEAAPMKTAKKAY